MIQDLTKSQKLLYEIIRKLNGVEDKTKLAKLQYFADFIHYAFYDVPISEPTNIYEKRKQGPLSIKFNSDLNILEKTALIEESPKYNFSIKKEIDTHLSSQENSTIEYVLNRYGKLSYDELLDICHAQIPHLSTKEDGIVQFFTAYNLVDQYPDYKTVK